jgi:hypothetical protein
MPLDLIPAAASREPGLAGRRSAALLQVSACPHPFADRRIDYVVPSGLSIAEIVELIQPDPVLRAHGVAFIGEHAVARDRWHRVRPKAGALLSIRLLPSGSGARIAAMIGIAVLAIALAVAAPYLTPLIAEGREPRRCGCSPRATRGTTTAR